MGQRFLFPVDTSPCPVLSPTVSQLFPRRHRLETISDQGFSSALYTDTILSPPNSPDIITISLSPSVSKLRSGDELGGSRCKLPRPSDSERGPGPEYITYVLSSLTFGDRAKIPMQLTGFSDLVHGFLSGPPLLVGGGSNYFFSLWPEPAVSGPDVTSHT